MPPCARSLGVCVGMHLESKSTTPFTLPERFVQPQQNDFENSSWFDYAPARFSCRATRLTASDEVLLGGTTDRSYGRGGTNVVARSCAAPTIA